MASEKLNAFLEQKLTQGMQQRFVRFYQFILSVTVITVLISASLFILWDLYQLVSVALACLVGFTLPIYFLYRDRYCAFSISYLAIVSCGMLVVGAMIPFSILAPFWLTFLVLAFALFSPAQKYLQIATILLISIACLASLFAYNAMGLSVELGHNSPFFAGTLFILSAVIIVGTIHFYVHQLSNERQNRELFEQLLKEKQAQFEFKSRFLSTMSHEIRTPLNGIFGIMQIVENMSIESKAKDYIQQANGAIHHLQTLLNDVLDYSRLETDQLELEEHAFTVDDLIKVARATFQSQAFYKGLQFTVNNDVDSNVLFTGDVTRIRQVVLNLISNAIKFTDFGAVTLSISGKAQDKNQTEGHYYLHIEVLDTGIGMSSHELHSLFKPFSQIHSNSNKYTGAGLGLCISQAILKRMQSKLSVASVKDAGSKFFFTLDLPAHQNTTHQPSPSSNYANLNTEQEQQQYLRDVCCLIVDDNQLNLMVTKAMLEGIGMRAIIASSGEEAIKILREREQTIHLVLMDMQMPGLDGAETTRIIRSQLGIENIPILALTADVDNATAAQCRLAGMNAVLTKPIELTNLRESVYHQLKKIA